MLETTPAGPDALASTPAAGMKKSKSLEVYLDAREDEDDGDGDGGACASAGDEAKKRNFVDKCINKVRSLVTTAAGKRTPPDPKK